MKAHRTYRHEALLYRGPEDFLARTVPFVLEGLVRRQPVLVAVPEPRLGLLRDRLGDDAARVELVDMTELGRNPARIISRWREFVDEHPGRTPVRGVGEPVWAGRHPRELAECQLHEALLNVAVEPDTPLWLRCPYDVGALDAPLLEAALSSHPVVVDGEETLGSTRYGGLAHVDELFGSPLPEPDVSVDVDVHVTDFGTNDLARVRALVGRRAQESGLGRDRVADLVLAVTELATNSVRHGGGGGRLRTWREDDALVLEVSDAGRVSDPLAGRRAPDWTQEGGRGLWLANQLCDLVHLRSGPWGTTVRVCACLRPA